MKANLIILCLICSCFYSDVNAQYDPDNMKKYWFYRHRLVNYFTQVGPDAGESLMSDSRNEIDIGGPLTSDELHYGDQTIYLGRYIAILATEYKLLSDNGQSTEETARELFFALHAVNRLDLVAETLFGEPAELNGFFYTR